MKLNLKALTMASAIAWGGCFLLVAVANVVWPPYGESWLQSWLQLGQSIYPGYNGPASFGSVIIVTIYPRWTEQWRAQWSPGCTTRSPERTKEHRRRSGARGTEGESLPQEPSPLSTHRSGCPGSGRGQKVQPWYWVMRGSSLPQ